MNRVFVAGDTAIDLLKPSHEKALDGVDENQKANFQELLDRKPNFVAACSIGSMTMRAWMVALTIIPASSLIPWLRSVSSLFDGWANAGDVGRGGVMLVAVLLIAIPVVAINVVLGELIPKSYAAAHPVWTSLRLVGFVRVFSILFSGPIKVFVSLAGLVTKRFGATLNKKAMT